MALNLCNDSFVEPGTQTDREGHGRSKACARLPLAADLGEVVRPDVGGPAAVGPEVDRNFVVGKLHVRVGAGQRRIVPFLDLSQVDAGQNLRRKSQLFRYSRERVGGYDCAEYYGHVQ